MTGRGRSRRRRGRGHSPVGQEHHVPPPVAQNLPEGHHTNRDACASPPEQQTAGGSHVHNPGIMSGRGRPWRGRGHGRSPVRQEHHAQPSVQQNRSESHHTYRDAYASPSEQQISGESHVYTPGKMSGRGRPWRGRGRRHSPVRQERDAPPPVPQNLTEEHRRYPDPPEQQSSGRSHVHKTPSSESVPEEAHSAMPGESPVLPIYHKRPGVGTLGRPIKLTSNCFPLEFPSGNVYHYDVEIMHSKNLTVEGGGQKKYRCSKTKKNREIMEELLCKDPAFRNMYGAYDGQRNLYTRNPLPSRLPFPHRFVVPERSDLQSGGLTGGGFEVKIEPVKKEGTASCAIDLDAIHDFYHGRTSSVAQDAIMVLETILRHGPCMRFTPIGRSFFFPPNPRFSRSFRGGLEIWFGYHQSIRIGQWKPIVNFDVTATLFYKKGPLLDSIAEFIGTNVESLYRGINHGDIKRINRDLKDMEIEATHLRYPRKYRIIRLLTESANDLHFDMTINGKTVQKSVAQYFREQYKIGLKFPHLPCLRLKPIDKKIYLPIEVCHLTEGQHYKRSLTAEQKSDMIKFTSIEPRDRFSEIENIMSKAGFSKDKGVQEFDLKVSPNPLNLNGRVLSPPTVRYEGNEFRPKDGSWNMLRNKFFVGAEVKSWVFLSFAQLHHSVLNKFSELLVRTARNLGMAIDEPKFTCCISNERNPVSLLQDMRKKYGADMILIVVPTSKESIYNRIKEAAETEIGITTQFVLQMNLLKSTDPKRPPSFGQQYATNLCQKINTKMGGINNSLVRNEIPKILWDPVIIIGADVNHPEPTSNSIHSLAACVGTVNLTLTRYSATIRAQTHRDENKKSVEVILDLTSMVEELLLAFYRNTQKKPQKIILYRDGVSEGQLAMVKYRELESVRKACKRLQKDGYEPGITVIVVQKRHHVRFMPDNPRDGVGKKGNVPPGTVVDTQVVHPAHFDFFLCSHYGLQGTSRPAHYTVLYDDNNFTADDIQKFSNQLCYTSARCTKSISIPVPVAYADLLAYRARQYVNSRGTGSSAASTSSYGFAPLSTQEVRNAIDVVPELKNSMFFV